MSRGVVGRVKGKRSNRLKIEWEIPDFLSLPAKLGKKYYSPKYFFGDTSWYIEVYPNGWISNGRIHMFVVRGDSGPPVTVTSSLFLKKTEGRKAVWTDKKRTFSEKGDLCGFLRISTVKRSEVIRRNSEFLPSGVLTVVCTMKFNGQQQTEAGRMTRITLKNCTKNPEAFTQTETHIDYLSEKLSTTATPDKKFVRDYQELLLNRDGCDVTLVVKGQKFEAHRAFLRARSPVFASMLSHNMKEKNTGQIDIADCDPEHFPEFLRFLYCGSVDSVTSQNACSLYRAADKYDVRDLKSECLAFMRSHFDVENFCDILILALQHSESDLIKLATRFFAENMKKIILTVKWQVFLAENPTQGNELFIKAVGADKGSNVQTL